jgi:hypothetical protein
MGQPPSGMTPHVAIGVTVHALAIAKRPKAEAIERAKARADRLIAREAYQAYDPGCTIARMRTRPLAVGFALSFCASASLVFACSQGNPVESQTPSASTATAATNETPPSSSGSPTAKSPDISTCKDLPVDLTTELPDGGVTMTNASPPPDAADAGPSDRLGAIHAMIRSANDRYRCCFDAGGKNARGTETKIVLELELTPKGDVRRAEIDKSRSDAIEQPIEDCMVNVAKGLSYAESGVSKDTVYHYDFHFRGHQ